MGQIHFSVGDFRSRGMAGRDAFRFEGDDWRHSGNWSAGIFYCRSSWRNNHGFRSARRDLFNSDSSSSARLNRILEDLSNGPCEPPPLPSCNSSSKWIVQMHLFWC